MYTLTHRQILWICGGIGLLAMIVWTFLLFRSVPEVTTLPDIVTAGRPTITYDDASFIQEHPEQFLAQMLPLLGTLEAAVTAEDEENVQATATILRGSLLRWRDALPVTLKSVAGRYIEALDRLVQDKAALARAGQIQVLREIQTLALEQQRTSLQTLSQ